MKGVVIGWLIGTAATVGLIFILEVLGFWDGMDLWLCFIVGFGIGVLLSNLGMLIGALLDDSY